MPSEKRYGRKTSSENNSKEGDRATLLDQKVERNPYHVNLLLLKYTVVIADTKKV